MGTFWLESVQKQSFYKAFDFTHFHPLFQGLQQVFGLYAN